MFQNHLCTPEDSSPQSNYAQCNRQPLEHKYVMVTFWRIYTRYCIRKLSM